MATNVTGRLEEHHALAIAVFSGFDLLPVIVITKAGSNEDRAGGGAHTHVGKVMVSTMSSWLAREEPLQGSSFFALWTLKCVVVRREPGGETIVPVLDWRKSLPFPQGCCW